MESRELLFSPTHSYPPVPGSDSVSLTDVARSVLAGLPAVATCKDSMRTKINQVHISELLFFDSLHLNHVIGNNTTLQTILINSGSRDIVPSSLMRRVCSKVEPHICLTDIFQDTSDEELKEITYRELYEELLKYTIFSDDTLFVSHSITTNSMINSISSIRNWLV